MFLRPPSSYDLPTSSEALLSFLSLTPGVVLLVLAVPDLISARNAVKKAAEPKGTYFAQLVLAGALAVLHALSLPSFVTAGSLVFGVELGNIGSIILSLTILVAVRDRLPTASTALVFFYLLQSTAPLLCALADFTLQTLPSITFLGLHVLLSSAILTLELIGPNGWTTMDQSDYAALPQEEPKGAKPPSPLVKANILSRLYFSWNSQLLDLGLKKTLTQHDLLALPPWLQPERNADLLATCWERELQKASKPSLVRAIFRAFGMSWSLLAIPALAGVFLNIIQPQLLRLLLQFVTRYNAEGGDASKGYLLAVLMFIVSVLQPVRGGCSALLARVL